MAASLGRAIRRCREAGGNFAPLAGLRKSGILGGPQPTWLQTFCRPLRRAMASRWNS